MQAKPSVTEKVVPEICQKVLLTIVATTTSSTHVCVHNQNNVQSTIPCNAYIWEFCCRTCLVSSQWSKAHLVAVVMQFKCRAHQDQGSSMLSASLPPVHFRANLIHRSFARNDIINAHCNLLQTTILQMSSRRLQRLAQAQLQQYCTCL